MKSSALLALSAAVLGLAASSAAGEDRPNILFLFADDWGRHASIYGELNPEKNVNQVLGTPHFDALAREGVLFRNAHVSAPSCTPCRSALLSGQHFWRTGRGAILRGAVWDESIPSYPLLLEQDGYHIGYTYKVWGPGTPANAPYGGRENAFQQAGVRFNQFSQNVAKMMEEGKSAAEAKQALYGEARANFRQFLDARPQGAPFCYWFGPTNVHRTWIQGSGKALWGIDPDTLEGRMPPFLPDVPEVREDLADYFGEIQAWDAGIGVILEELEKTGERDRTLVVVSGDHGAPGFPYGKCNLYDFGTGVPLSISGPGVKGGRVVDDLVSLTDLAPTFLEAAGSAVPGVMTGRSLWNVLRSEASGQVDPGRDAVFTGRERHVENAREGYLPYPQRAIRTAGHSYIINFRPERWPLGDPYRLDGDDPPSREELVTTTRVTHPDEDAGPAKAWLVAQRDHPDWSGHYQWVYGQRPGEELYDLSADPFETRNLAGGHAHAAIQAELRERLLAELKSTGDPRMVDDGAYFENPPLAGPLEEN